MSTVLTFLTAALLLLAASLALVSAVGLMRFRSVYARSHPVTKAITLGVVAVCVAAAVQVDHPSDTAKLLLVAGFQVLTAPISAHLVARAAYRSGSAGADHMRVDEMKGVTFEQDRAAGFEQDRAAGRDPGRADGQGARETQTTDADEVGGFASGQTDGPRPDQV